MRRAVALVPAYDQPASTPRGSAVRRSGWDDEKIYLTAADGREHCVTDDPALRDRLADFCEAHFTGKKS
jgi:hypothetical protein